MYANEHGNKTLVDIKNAIKSPVAETDHSHYV